MKIDFNFMEQKMTEHFKGGNGHLLTRIAEEGNNKFLILKFPAGSSIGLHTHQTNCEAVYVLKGSGTAVCNDVEEKLYEGVCHFCPKGEAHTIIADSQGLELFAVIIEQ